ncbi:MAG: SpoIIE family protein phosphatase [Armatimonadota bacterium]|nr:SpoIIE family protein phosphatase [bacterium]
MNGNQPPQCVTNGEHQLPVDERAILLDDIIRHFPYPVLLIDSDCRILRSNPPALELLGVAKDELLTPAVCDSLLKIRPEDKYPLDSKSIARCFSGERLQDVETQVTLGDGSTRYYILHAIPLLNNDGQTDLVLVTGHDITETKVAENALREQRASLQSLFDNLPAGVILLDTADFRVRGGNREYISYLTNVPATVIGLRIEELLPQAAESGLMELLRQACEGNEPVKVNGFRYDGFELGTTYWDINIIRVPIPNRNDSSDALALLLLDVTEEVKASQEMQDIYRREHEIAQKLQMSFIPHDLADLDGFEVAQHYLPARDQGLVGGDFYDLFELGDGCCGVVMGDVAGKGLDAAVYTAMTKYMLKAYALFERDPAIAMCRLNTALSQCTPTELFVTLIYGVLDTRTRVFIYANAGHEQPIHFAASSGATSMLNVTGPALGLLPVADYETHKVDLSEGDIIMLYTDGITDAGKGVNRLGHDCVLKLLELAGTHPVDVIADSILNQVMTFSNGRLADDAALLVLKAISLPD